MNSFNSDTEFLAYLDKIAFKNPHEIPDEVLPQDKVAYRIYFMHIASLYLLFKNNILDKAQLQTMKNNFISNWNFYHLYQKSNMKSHNELRKFSTAIHDCRKNSDNCILCNNISHIIGAVTGGKFA